MPDLLLELFSEEIPARMQRQAAEDLKRLVTNALVDASLPYEGAQAFATPRRLTLHVVGLPEAQPRRVEERKGPRVGAPDGAIQGFLKSAGLARIEDAKIETDAQEGRVLRRQNREGRPRGARSARRNPAADPARVSLAEVDALGRRLGRARRAALGAAAARDPVHVRRRARDAGDRARSALGGIAAGDVDLRPSLPRAGARFVCAASTTMSPRSPRPRSCSTAERRKSIILADAQSLALAHGLELIEDEGLLDEVAGLVEWPVMLMGEFEPAFLDIPPEVIRATIRANQKCFVLRDGGAPQPSWPGLSGHPRGDARRWQTRQTWMAGTSPAMTWKRRRGGSPTSSSSSPTSSPATAARRSRRAMAASCARGSSDARHFWRTDLAPLPDYKDKADKPLDQRLEKLKALGIVFHEKLGTQGERVERIAALARELAPIVGADAGLAERAAQLAKADLVTEMVGEFPELQGLMGRYYASAQGEEPSVADAIEDHYKPQGPNDRVPTSPVSIAVALADKLDTLVGFWAIDEKPTGSKDPYALRRAALGVIRHRRRERREAALARRCSDALPS